MFTRMLIQLGDKKPDIDAQNNNGDTALHIATRNGNIHCIKLLLLAYANPHIKNNTGETAKKIAKKIRKRYPTLKKINFEQTTLKSNLQKYKQIERTFNDLLEIIQNNKVKNAKKYIKKIPINWSNNSGNTALHTAALFKRYEIIAMLLINGADPNQTNNLGENALHHLLNNPPSDKKGTKHCINCIQLFLNHDVNITAQTNMNMTALQLARIHKNKTIIAFLEKKIKDLQPIKLRNTVDKT